MGKVQVYVRHATWCISTDPKRPNTDREHNAGSHVDPHAPQPMMKRQYECAHAKATCRQVGHSPV